MALDASIIPPFLSVLTAYTVFLSIYTTCAFAIPHHATVARLAAVLALAVITNNYIQPSFYALCPNPFWRCIVSTPMWASLLSASEILLCSRVDFSECPHALGQTRSAIALLWNMRRIGTKFEVKKTLPPPPLRNESVVRFVARQLVTVVVSYSIVESMIRGPLTDPAFVGVEKQTLWPRSMLENLSGEDVGFRIVGSVAFLATSVLVNLTLTNTLAILSLVTGLSTPAAWPPLFGSFAEAYTVRNFWG